MKPVFCNKCSKLRRVSGFVRDDPVLGCGHVKKPDESCVLDFCPICRKRVSIYIDIYKNARCGGNLFDDAGCGSLIREMVRKVS